MNLVNWTSFKNIQVFHQHFYIHDKTSLLKFIRRYVKVQTTFIELMY